MTVIIPAIDIINGQAVRLEQGDYSRKKEYMSPLEAAQKWQQAGAKMLHIVDLDGAKEGKPVNVNIISEIIEKTGIKVELGGGIRTENDLKQIFDSGVTRAIIGSAAVKEPKLVEKWLQDWGPEKIVIGADILDKKVAISGWQEKSSLGLNEFVTDWQQKSAKYFLITDISRDGMLQGSNIALYRHLMEDFPNITLIASGGIGSQKDVDELEQIDVPYVIVGKALYEGKIIL